MAGLKHKPLVTCGVLLYIQERTVRLHVNIVCSNHGQLERTCYLRFPVTAAGQMSLIAHRIWMGYSAANRPETSDSNAALVFLKVKSLHSSNCNIHKISREYQFPRASTVTQETSSKFNIAIFCYSAICFENILKLTDLLSMHDNTKQRYLKSENRLRTTLIQMCFKRDLEKKINFELSAVYLL
jgi:hypothetical protein